MGQNQNVINSLQIDIDWLKKKLLTMVELTKKVDELFRKRFFLIGKQK